MKIMVDLQRLLALVTMIVGFFLMLMETPLSEGLSSQAWLTFGGMFIVLLSVGWMWLINKEERYFIHEAR